MAASPNAALFQPLQLGSVTVPNRVMMAPLTRCRADPATHAPTPVMAEHYGQRRGAGLVIAEATLVAPKTSAFYSEPGCYDAAQHQAGWKAIADAVQADGGKLAVQLFHPGRAAHPVNNDGQQPVSATAEPVTSGHVAPEFNAKREKLDYPVPRALDDDELPGIVAQFAAAAKIALAAGADMIEIHGANGYLLDQFLRAAPSARTGPYGGSVENRARLLLEVVDAVSEVMTPGRVGVRLSPLNSFQSMKDEDPLATMQYVAEQLVQRKTAFLHLLRADFFGMQKADNIVATAKSHLAGSETKLIVNAGYTPAEALAVTESGEVDAVVFGTSFLANPDLVERIKLGKDLNAPRPDLFYTGGVEGYNDYPALSN